MDPTALISFSLIKILSTAEAIPVVKLPSDMRIVFNSTEASLPLKDIPNAVIPLDVIMFPVMFIFTSPAQLAV